MSENPYGERPANLTEQAAVFYDRHDTHWGGDTIGPFEVTPTPEGEQFLARLADSVRGQK